MEVCPTFRTSEDDSVSLSLITTAVAAALLAACGGGTSTSPAPPASSAAESGSGSGNQIAAGTITGFGSVIVDGVCYEDSGATPTAASEGRSVDAEGSMVPGVLKATKLRLR